MSGKAYFARVAVLLGLAILSLAWLTILPRVPQSQAYHLFADNRSCLGIANFGNVVSNLPFVVIGAIGLLTLRGDTATRILFFGILATGFGSIYYHLDPNDASLFWDRLPMTVTFMAILAGQIEERVSARAGALLLWPLLALGLASLLWWQVTDDLRLYAWVQFFPIVAMLLMFWLFPPRYTGTGDWLIAFALYGVAKALEHLDASIYAAGALVSGHTLKHLVAAAACAVVLRHFLTRQPVTLTRARERERLLSGAARSH